MITLSELAHTNAQVMALKMGEEEEMKGDEDAERRMRRRDNDRSLKSKRRNR
jgi:hypothetical protein